MTESDLARIESDLGIRLPEAYRVAMLHYPIPACVGNDDTELWDSASRLIELNRELRTGRYSIKPWPPKYFAVGRDSGGCCQALDLQDATVTWADRGHLPELGGTPSTPVPFTTWCPEYLAGLRSALDGDGIDPDGTPEAARHQMDLTNRSGDKAFCGCIVVLLILLGVAVAFRIRG